jgi:hypothetical protein
MLNSQNGGEKNKDKKDIKKKDKKDNKIKKIGLTEKNDIIRNIYDKIDNKIEPIKIIYQYRNNNKKIEYEIFIFIGIIGARYKTILERIKDLDIYNTLKEITIEEEKKLSRIFGEFWITKFFNKYHISSFINKLENNDKIKRVILDKYEESWLLKFINNFKSDVIFKKINYSYAELIKLEYKIRMGKKLEKINLEKEDIEELNFSKNTKKSNNILYDISKEIIEQKGGKDENDASESIEDYENEELVDEDVDEDMDEDIEEDEIENILDIEEDIIDLEKDQETDDEIDLGSELKKPSEDDKNLEINLEEIERIYQADVVDNNFEVTSDMLSKILDNKNLTENKSKYLVSLSDEKDDYLENDDLSNVYKKTFIYNDIIYKDDTIKMIKNKITANITNNKKFGKQNYLIPSRIYLWSEYLINNKVEKVVLGYKWMKKNELLNYDIEPLALYNYENMENNIKKLRDSIKRYAGKIRREDEDSHIYYDYENYILNDEIFMIDIYNELGLNYKVNDEKITNLIDTYLKLYFPRIKQEDFTGIIEYLNNNTKVEDIRIKNSFETIYNDVLIEREITDIVDIVKIDQQKEYKDLFSVGNFIINTFIHVNLIISDNTLEKINLENIDKINESGVYGTVTLPKLDLFRIFNDITPDDKYSFIQYQMADGQLIFKYYENYMYEFTKTKDNIELLTKWFENSPYGISFKVKQKNNKFMAININEVGRVEYKTQWKEEDKANIYDIIDTYEYVKELIIKINETLINHPKKINIKIPEDWEFRFRFINCIQKFKLPTNKLINHNDLSEFSRFFFPYVSMVIEPRKRLSKGVYVDEKSKYGTYLRFKRDSDYDNDSKIEQRILSYLRSMEIEDDILIDEVSKQFNITPEKAKEELNIVKTKFPNLKKNRKIRSEVEGAPKFKKPGIQVDIQGRVPEKYIIRISGARNQKQLERMILFLNILIYLYSETYILKKPERQFIREKLKNLTNVAKRRQKVDQIVNYDKEIKEIKKMIQIDKKRLGFKAEEGQNPWSRSCQNSGKDKRRRPQLFNQKNIDELLKKGYILNKKTGEYEKKVIIKNKKKSSEIILRAIKVKDINEQPGGTDLYYTCDPEDNGQHTFIGFLTKGNNPFGECMPCCFKKDPLVKDNKEKIDFYKRCMGLKDSNEKITQNFSQGDILYILQDTNKISENRIGYLPKYIDIFTNYQFNKNKEIKNHYLLKTDGYYFKLGVKQDDYSFLNTISIILNMSIKEIKDHIINFLKKDVSEKYYMSLNDGDIRSEFKIGDFINFINDNDFIDYIYLKDILKIEGLFTENGIYPIVFNKITTIISTGIEKEKIKEDYILDIDKTMIIDSDYCYELLEKKDIIILLRDSKIYYPFVEVIKTDRDNKNVDIIKIFSNNKTNIKLIEEIKKYLFKTISDTNIDNIKTNSTARETYRILNEISKNKKYAEYEPVHQVFDSRFKIKFIITKNNTIIPVLPSGMELNLNAICINTNEDKMKIDDCFSKIELLNIESSNHNLEILFKLSNKKINIKPIGVFYDNIDKKNNVNIIGIITSNNDLVPIQIIKMNKNHLDKNNILYYDRPLYYELDQKLEKYNKNNVLKIDERIKNVNLNKYTNEAYELFKFEISNFINMNENKLYREELKKLLEKKNINEIEDYFLKLSISKLNGKIINKDNIVGPELIKLINDIPNIDYYKINNQRILCEKLDENKCNLNPHCHYHNSKCSLALTDNLLFKFIKKLSNEIIEIDIKAYEILNIKNYYVSDIVDYNNFTEKPGQKIIKNTNKNLIKILGDLLGKEKLPKIGRRYYNKKNEIDFHQLELENPLKDIKEAFTQVIIPYNNSIFRAYANGYYWHKHILYEPNLRNLGYYSNLQNELINIFKSIIIDWLNIPSNIYFLNNLDDKIKTIINNPILNTNNFIKNDVLLSTFEIQKKLIINKYIVNMIDNNLETNYGILELFILNKIHLIPIVLLFNGVPTYYIDNKIIEIDNKDESINYLVSKNICINLEFNQNFSYPFLVDVLYYK